MKSRSGNVKRKVLGIFLMAAMASCGWGMGFKVIEDPRPTHVEKDFVKLVRVREIPPDINDEHFMAKPMSLAVATDGSVFVYDYLVRKIFKFTKQGDLVKVFGSVGRGPGEFGKKPDQNWLYAGEDNCVFLSSHINRKVIEYDLNGTFVDEFVLPSPEYVRGGFVPVASANNQFYILHNAEHRIDVFKPQGNRLTKSCSLLEGVKRDWSVLLNVRDQDMYSWRSGSMIDILYDFGSKNRLLVYLTKTSTIYVFQDNQLLKTYNVWPEQVLENYRVRIAERANRLKGRERFIVRMFFKFFIDKDDPSHFYLTGSKTAGKKEYRTYRLSIDGQLDKVLISDSPVIFHAKKNGIFYGIYKGSIFLYKEEETK